MPQKAQITKHEYKGNYFHKVCIHCNIHKFKDVDKPPYYAKDGEHIYGEPKCITRHKEQEAGKL